ncbi:MAG: hypothetical protein LBR85_08100 [Oscillospiraceae bacterium]|jgi:cation transport ATPase|nr:hypothetical protein [Oscillospiraceae bacterium]
MIFDPPLWLVAARLGFALAMFVLGALTPAPMRVVAHVLGWVIASADLIHPKSLVRPEHALMLAATFAAHIFGMSGGALASAIAFRAAGEFSSRFFAGRRARLLASLDPLPDRALVFRDGAQVSLPPSRVIPGDAVIVRPGDVIPADALIVKGESLVGYPPGGPEPVKAGPGDTVYAGGNNETGLLAVKAVSTGDDTLARRWLALTSKAAASVCAPERALRRMTVLISGAVALLALTAGIVGAIVTRDGAGTLWPARAAGILLAASPLAVLTVFPQLRAKSVLSAARHGARVVSADALWELSRAELAVFDETGIQADGRLVVMGLVSSPGADRESLLRCAAIAQARGGTKFSDAVRDYCGDIACPADSYDDRAGGVIARFSGHTIYAGSAEFLDLDTKEYSNEVYWVALDGRLLGGLRVSPSLRSGAEGLAKTLMSCGIDTALLLSAPRAEAESVAERLYVRDIHAGLSEEDKPRILGEMLDETRGRALIFASGEGVDRQGGLGVWTDGFTDIDRAGKSEIILTGASSGKLGDLAELAKKHRRAALVFLCAVGAAKLACIALSLLGVAGIWVSGISEAALTAALVLAADRL